MKRIQVLILSVGMLCLAVMADASPEKILVRDDLPQAIRLAKESRRLIVVLLDEDFSKFPEVFRGRKSAWTEAQISALATNFVVLVTLKDSRAGQELRQRYRLPTGSFMPILTSEGALLEAGYCDTDPLLADHQDLRGRAEAYRSRVAELKEQGASGLLPLAGLYLAHGQVLEASKCYEEVCVKWPTPDRVERLAQCYEALGEIPAERKCLLRLVAQWPNDARCVGWRIRLATLGSPPMPGEPPSSQGAPPGELVLLREALRQEGDRRGEALVVAAMLDGYAVQADEDLALRERLIELVPGSDREAEERITLASMYQMMGGSKHLGMARDHLQKFLVAHPRHPLAQYVREELLPEVEAAHGETDR